MPRLRDPELLRAIGARIRALRVERHLTQEDLARRVALRPTAISRVEAGTLALSLGNLARVARELGVELAVLVGPDSSTSSQVLSPAEAELLVAWRAVPEERHDLARRMLRELAR